MVGSVRRREVADRGVVVPGVLGDRVAIAVPVPNDNPTNRSTYCTLLPTVKIATDLPAGRVKAEDELASLFPNAASSRLDSK
jgi:hypothetical protein